MFATLILLAFLATPPAAEADTMLVKDLSLTPASGEDTVLGWREVPASSVRPGQASVPNAHLDLLSTEEPLAHQQWPIDAIGLPRAWNETTGDSGVVIAVIDSGLEMSHPDLGDRLFVNEGEIPGNGVDDDGNGLVDDVSGWDVVDDDPDPTDLSVGHGTEVAGVAVASVNGAGIAGVAGSATVLPIRACSSQCQLFDVAWAITYAVDMGADVINLSIGGFAEPGPLSDAVEYAAGADVLLVAAAGNTGTDIDGTSFVPATIDSPNLVAVAATDANGRLWADSNYGRHSVDLGAPGVSIISTTLTSLGEYRLVTGTSFATPHVSGTAALMLSVAPNLEPSQIIHLLGSHGRRSADLESKSRFGSILRSDASVVAATLDDIHHSVFADDIVWAAVEGLTKGCNPPANDHYCPQRPVTRGEMAAFLDRALDLPPGPDTFTDDTHNPFQAHINAIAHAGLAKGCNPPANDHYCPQRPVTRGEMAAFLHRSLG